MFLEGNIMCFPLENGKYKLEVKTNVLRLNEIFHQAYCRGEIQLIELFALEKIIFDNDLNGYGKEMQVSIIAPIWEVVSNVTVNLSGIKTRNETSNKSGGIFYGIFNTLLVNSEHHLIIDVTGGNAKFFSFIGFSKPEFINRLDIRDSNNITHEMIDLPAPKEPIIFYQFPEVFIKYKKFVLSSMLKNKNSNSKFLYTNLSMNKDILIDYTTINIVEELWDLENYYSAESDKSFSLSMLKVYKQEVLDYFRKHTESISKSMRGIDHLNTFYSRKIQNLEDKFYKNPILHIKDYLTHILSDSENLRNTEIQNRLHIITKDFTVQFDKEIIEAESLIKNNLEVDLQNNIDNLNVEMKKLILEVDIYIKKKEIESKALEKQKRHLKYNMGLTIMFGILKSVCIAMALINPVCAVAGAIIIVGTSLLESAIITSPVPVTQIKVPVVVATKSNTAVKITLPTKYLNTLSGEITSYDVDKQKGIDFLKKTISELETERNKMKSNHEDTDMLDSTVDKLKRTCFNNPCPSDCAKKNLILKDLTKIESRHFKQMHVLNKVSTMTDTFQYGYETYIRARRISSQIKLDDNKIQEARNDIKNLIMYKENVNEQLKPQIEMMRNILNGVTEGLATSPTTAFLDFQKWRMDDYLSDVLKQLESWTKKFEVEDDIRETMIKIKSALQTTIHLHTLIKEFQSKIKNAQYLEEVAATPFQQMFINDPTLRKAYEKLSYSYYANEVLDEYNKWLISFKQYTFPFIKNYPEIDESPFTTFSTPLIKANVAVQNMKSLRSHLNKIEAHGYSVFTNIITAKFENSRIYRHFHQWDSTTSYTAIKDILNGKEVKLVANIFEKKNFNAVKFSNVHLLISTTSTDPKEERKLKRDLKKLLVTLTHNGDSYYRCDDKVYLIESGIINFQFNFLNSKPQVINNKAADYVLSPFATWTIQLNNVLETVPFNSLVKYANNVKIELVGDGQYLKLNNSVCQDDLTKYYGEDIKAL